MGTVKLKIERFCICPKPEPYRYFSELFNVVKVECQRCFKQINPKDISEKAKD